MLLNEGLTPWSTESPNSGFCGDVTFAGSCSDGPDSFSEEGLKAYAAACGEDTAADYVVQETGIDPRQYISNGQIDWKAAVHTAVLWETGVNVDINSFIGPDGEIKWEGIAQEAGAIGGAAACTAIGAGVIAPICSYLGGKLGKALYEVGEALFGSDNPPPPPLSYTAAANSIRDAIHGNWILRCLAIRGLTLTTLEAAYQIQQTWNTSLAAFPQEHITLVEAFGKLNVAPPIGWTTSLVPKTTGVPGAANYNFAGFLKFYSGTAFVEQPRWDSQAFLDANNIGPGSPIDFLAYAPNFDEYAYRRGWQAWCGTSYQQATYKVYTGAWNPKKPVGPLNKRWVPPYDQSTMPATCSATVFMSIDGSINKTIGDPNAFGVDTVFNDFKASWIQGIQDGVESARRELRAKKRDLEPVTDGRFIYRSLTPPKPKANWLWFALGAAVGLGGIAYYTKRKRMW